MNFCLTCPRPADRALVLLTSTKSSCRWPSYCREDMGKPSTWSVTLNRDGKFQPWGIRLAGGADLNTPLIITKVRFERLRNVVGTRSTCSNVGYRSPKLWRISSGTGRGSLGLIIRSWSVIKEILINHFCYLKLTILSDSIVPQTEIMGMYPPAGLDQCTTMNPSLSL